MIICNEKESNREGEIKPKKKKQCKRKQLLTTKK